MINRILVVIPLLVLVACSQGTTTGPERPNTSGHAREVHSFEGLPRLARTTSLVVVGTVSEVRDGRLLGTDPETQIQMLELVIEVEDVVKGSTQDFVLVETDPVNSWANEWREVGQRLVLFLDRTNDAAQEIYHPISSVGVFIRNGDDILAASPQPVAAEIAQMTLPEIRAQVRRS